MRIIPAIDLSGGRCVRLLKGDFEQETLYSDDPPAVARSFTALAVTDLHVVDLDGARTGRQRNGDIVGRISSESPIDVQIGGGLRSTGDLDYWFERGVRRCVVGSVAVEEPRTVCEWIDQYGADRMVVAFDVRVEDGTPRLVTHGWTRTSKRSLWDALSEFSAAGLTHLLCTDVNRDGAMEGPNVSLYAEVISRFPSIRLQASGGVRHIADLEALRSAGADGAITGRALLDGRITGEEIAGFPQSA